MPIRFSDLAALADEGSPIPLDALSGLGIVAPDEVLKQFFADHATKVEFQEQYGAVVLDDIAWALESRPAQDLSEATAYKRFRDWMKSVARRADDIGTDGWNSIDVRPDVVAHWQQNRTWLRAPVFLDGVVGEGLHLVEGHTRVGLLGGLIGLGLVDPKSCHLAWVGRLRENASPPRTI